MGIDNTPTTFYVGSDGIVRYMVVGGESHGDSPARVSWYRRSAESWPLRFQISDFRIQICRAGSNLTSI